MKRIITFLMLLFIISKYSYSQDHGLWPVRISGIHFGISNNKMRENLISKTIHRGFGLSVGTFIEIIRYRTLQVYDLDLGVDFLKSRFESETGSYKFNLSATYKYLVRLSSTDSKTGFYLGPHLNINSLITYFDNWDENHYYWLTGYSLGAGGRIQSSTSSGDEFKIDFDIPLTSLVSRPPENLTVTQSGSEFTAILKQVNKDPVVTSLFQHFYFNLRTGYSFRNLRRMEPTIFWEFIYLANRQVELGKITNINNLLGVEFNF